MASHSINRTVETLAHCQSCRKRRNREGLHCIRCISVQHHSSMTRRLSRLLVIASHTSDKRNQLPPLGRDPLPGSPYAYPLSSAHQSHAGMVLCGGQYGILDYAVITVIAVWDLDRGPASLLFRTPCCIRGLRGHGRYHDVASLFTSST